MAVSTKYFPFVMGLDQTVDDRLLEPGRPRAIENLAIRKRGRLGMRYDYDALASTLQGPGTLNLYDLVAHNGRLHGLGEVSTSGFSPQSPSDILEYANQALFAWRRSPQVLIATNQQALKLPIASYPRAIGRTTELFATSAPINMDVAAGNGLVCSVWERPGVNVVVVHVFNPATDATVLYEELNNFKLPRVVCTGTKFFIGCTNNTGTTPKLFRFDPAVDTLCTALTDPAAAGGAINSFDMSLSHEGTTFWMVYGRAGPLTRIHGFDANGTETHDFAGPAVLCFFITVFTEATVAATVRIHLACVINATNAVNLSTYLGATSALETNTPAFAAGATSQVGLCMNAVSAGTNPVLMAFQATANIARVAYISNTHAIAAGPDTYQNATLNSKLLTSRTHGLFACRLTEGASASTHMLAQYYLVDNLTVIPTAIADRLQAVASAAAELPNLAFDAARQRLYWMRSVLANADFSQVSVMELGISRQDRRQTAALGDALYLAGAITTVYEGRSLTEANFLDRPTVTITGQGVTGAGLDLLGVYQFVGVFEAYDAHGNRVQSPPSDVVTGTLTGANNQFNVSLSGPHSLRSVISLTGVFGEVERPPLLVLYRTRNNADGNLTFYRETSSIASVPIEAAVAFISNLPDDTLDDREILYTQGARGAQSGALPFVAPEGCGSIAASADRILTGQLPALSRIQESRPLFPSEQANWSDSIGFIRDTRGRVLAVARLDERRIIWTDFEMFEMDGEGLDDNGNGTLGAPRRIPSDTGLFGGDLGWRSIVECSLGLMYQGLSDQIYLLPRGGGAPQPIGMAVQDRLAAFPTVTSGTYMPQDQTVRFTCNNTGGTDSIQLLYDIVQQAWITEGPFGFPIASSANYQGRMTILGSNIVRQQRAQHPPVAFIANAWRSGSLHPFGLGQWGRVLNFQFYGEYRGDCTLRCIATYDDLTTETLKHAEVNALDVWQAANAPNSFLATLSATTLAVGAPFSFKFTPDRIKCECVRVDFEVDIPFPTTIAISFSQNITASNALSVTLSASRAIGDRVVIVILLSSATANPPTSAGWTSRSSQSTPVGRQEVLERILDGSEASPVSFVWTGTATAAFSNHWTLRNSHPTAPIEVATVVQASIGTHVNATGPLVPSWGLANTRWITCVCIDDRPAAASNVMVTPEGFKRGINAANISATANLSGQVEGGDLALRATSLQAQPGWDWTDPSSARNFLIAVRPNDALVSEGLVYHYWAMDVEDAGKSALKSPLQMG